MNQAVIPVTIAVEGDTDAAIIGRVLGHLGIAKGPTYGLRGKHWLDRRLVGYNNAARFSPWLVVRDLDHDAVCPKELTERLLANPSSAMRLRIAVRSSEAWLLADSDNVSRFLGVHRQLVPEDPEELSNPKDALVQLARRSRIQAIRQDIVPAAGMHSRVGPGYTARLIEFATRHWSPALAAPRSRSLLKTISALRELVRG